MKLAASTDEEVRAYADHLMERSIPALLVERARQDPDGPAIRYKQYGIYRELSWSDYLRRIERVCAAFLDLGLQRGDRVAIMGDPRIEWLLADLGAVSAGALSYGIYSTCSPEQVGFQVQNADARYFVAEDQEHLDKLLETPEADSVEHIIVVDPRTLFLYDDPRIQTFEAFEQRGARALDRDPEMAQRAMLSAAPDDLAVMTFTSGTTGEPKGAVHTHRDAIVGMTYPYLYFYPELRTRSHRTVTYLALAHLVERSMSCWLPLISDCVAHIGEKREGLQQLLFDVQPTFFHAVPRIWEKLAAQIDVAVEMSSPLKRASFDVANRVGRRWVENRWEGRTRPHLEVAHWIIRHLVFRQALHKVGMAELEGGLTAGAPIPTRIHAQWQAWGVALRDLYGITEGTLVFSQIGRFPNPTQGGTPAYPKQVRLSDQGEVIVSGPGLFSHYWDNPEATERALVDGELHTGDVATESDDGFRIVDRIKDIMITSGGKNISPAEVENTLKGSPYISEAVLIADGRKFPSCLVEIDFDTVAQWAGEHGVSFTGFTDLSQHPEVEKLIRREIERANEKLAHVEQPKKFRIIPKELDPEEGDTTPTRKVKRTHMAELFEELIDSMYANGSEPEGDRRQEAVNT